MNKKERCDLKYTCSYSSESEWRGDNRSRRRGTNDPGADDETEIRGCNWSVRDVHEGDGVADQEED